MIQSFSFRQQTGLVLPLEAVLVYLEDGPRGVMETLRFFEKKKLFSSATIHRYLSEGITNKWIKTGTGVNKRQKSLSLTYAGKSMLVKLRGYYQ